LPRGVDDGTMSLIVEQCETLANVQKVTTHYEDWVEAWMNAELTSESMAAFARFSSLKELNLQFSHKLTDSSLSHIVELPIEKLDLGGCNGLTSDAMRHIVALRCLKDLDLHDVSIGDDGLKILANCKTLQSLILTCSEMTDAGLKTFSSPTSALAKTLVDLRITSDGNITNEGIAHLANGFKKLKTLWIHDRREDCLVTGGCLRHIGQGIPLLKNLSLELNNLRDDDLQPLHGLKHLISFHLRYTIAFTGRGLSYLRDIPTLRELIIGSNALSAEGLASLQFLPKLETLCINNNDISNRVGSLTDEMMAHIKHLTSLKHLSWAGEDTQDNGHVTDASLVYLHGLKHLESLVLNFCPGITTEGLLDLARACKSLKRLKIFRCESIDEEGVKALQAMGLDVITTLRRY